VKKCVSPFIKIKTPYYFTEEYHRYSFENEVFWVVKGENCYASIRGAGECFASIKEAMYVVDQYLIENGYSFLTEEQYEKYKLLI
jgi:hypothetical protein